MAYRKPASFKFVVLFLTAATLSIVSHGVLTQSSVLAQSFGDNPNGFPIPSSLPEGSSLQVDGSTSMKVTNQELESRFESQYPNVDVELDASRTDEAIQALLNGDIDLVATGRPLTDEEKAEGLIEVPLEREKLAILLGQDNPFEGNISFDQFARIFRGEITNWSGVGGPDLPIRMVDRPDYSDTRRALSTYEVFEGQPFQTGSTADPVSEDETQAIIDALGNDGIGYAVYSQVEGVDNVRILPMHETLPNDPRYPYSQYRAFVYREGATPATLAFLRFATTAPGQEIISEVEAAATTAEPEEDVATQAPDETTETIEDETALALDAGVAEETRGGFPWWLLWLLGIPLLGGLLWWLLKRTGASAPAAAPVAAPIGTPAAAPVGAPLSPEPRLILTPRSCKDAYAYWEVPESYLRDLKRQGGDKLMLRLYDATDLAPGAALPGHTAQYDCVNQEPDLHIPIPIDDRDYRAELGYLTQDARWLPIAKSASVHVPACPKPAVVPPKLNVKDKSVDVGSPKITLPNIATVGAAAGAAAVGAAALGAARGPKERKVASSRIILTPRNNQKGYVYWEVPEQVKARAKAEGGKSYQLRIHDATDIDIKQQPPHSTLTYVVDESDCDRFVPLPETNRDYIADIGYRGDDNSWLSLACSEPVRIDRILGQDSETDISPALGLMGSGAIGAGTGVLGGKTGSNLDAENAQNGGLVSATVTPVQHQCAIQTVKVHSRNNALRLDQGQMNYIQDSVSVRHPLEQGLYILRIRDGIFNYDGDDTHPGEPFVLLWIYGGKVVNQKTGVPVSATWSTLNGYADTLTLDVKEPAQVCAFFIDTFGDDNLGEVALSVIKL